VKKLESTPHPAGGTFHWFEGGGRLFSILDNGYPHADDFEIWERDPNPDAADPTTGIPGVILGTEQRASSMSAAAAIVEKHLS
jgi:hypothetical protein